jgi:glycosyltransferase involved in cell wall biosynthesis
MRFSLVIPCFNESKNIPLLLKRCKELASLDDVEVILVDNGSTDDSSEVLERLLPDFSGCRTIRVERNQGYGFGILQGLNSADGDIIGWTHADMQTDPLDALKGLELFHKHGPDIFVKGRRYGRALADVVFTYGMSVFETLLLRKPMWDINAQPTIFSRKFYETWNNPPFDFSLDLYAYYTARCSGLPVYRFPVKFGERAHGVSHWNVNWAAKRKFISRTVSFSLILKKRLES